MTQEGDKAMNNESQWPEDQADWPYAVGAVQGGVVPAKPAQLYGKTRQEAAADAVTKVKGGAA